MKKYIVLTLGIIGITFLTVPAQDTLSSRKTLHLVATAHFDTQWRWTVQQSIDEFLKNTLLENFALFEKYPHYTFNFEGAIKYMWAKEYYPDEYQKLKKYIAGERWHICGSSLDATDVNIPSPESVIRTILIGEKFYQQEFGKKSYDVFLPDCFGFGYALPSIMAHCGLKGFSTQKLTWGSAYGVPFHIGAWQGVDGSKVLACLSPGDYGTKLRSDMSYNKKWLEVATRNGEQYGLPVAYAYFGTGDQGGSPGDSSALWLNRSVAGTGPLKVISAPADLLCRQVSATQLQRLPVHNNELLATTHGTGCYTSQCAMKRWNRKNEQLGDAAERAAVIAYWLGASYPKERLQKAWIQFLWHQFHDDLTGTSIPEVYRFSWNDEILSMNLFNGVLQESAGTICKMMNTQVNGIPVAVYNPLSFDREELAEATVEFPSRTPMVQVFNKEGKEVPSQVISVLNNKTTVLFLARVPSVGFEIYDVKPAPMKPDIQTGLLISANQLENEYYRVSIDKNGDIASIYDKKENKELLNAPIRIAYFENHSDVWPAWEITYKTICRPPLACLNHVISQDIVEQGPVRVTLRIIRELNGSVFTQYISLAAGETGRRVEVKNHVAWNTRGTLVKAIFPVSVTNQFATYDLGMGTIRRGNNRPELYEVPAQQWADITAEDESYGVSILNDCKVGWDKPADNILRLTLFHTPASSSQEFQDNTSNDLGRHEFTYAITGHKGSWKDITPCQAASLNQPLYTFQTVAHQGPLGKSFSFVKPESKQVMIKALKLAEEGDNIIMRVQEMHGQNAEKIKITFTPALRQVKKVNGIEEEIPEKDEGKEVRQKVQKDSILACSLTPYQPAAYALQINRRILPAEKIKRSLPLALPCNKDGFSYDHLRTNGDIDGQGNSIPAELLPPGQMITFDGISFRLGNPIDNINNMMACKGQTLVFPSVGMPYNKLAVLAFGLKDTQGMLRFKEKTKNTGEAPLSVQSGFGFIGQWDTRILTKDAYTLNRINGQNFSPNIQLIPGYIKRDPVAWFATHLHNAKTDKNVSYTFAYFYYYLIDLPQGTTAVTFPDNEAIIIVAASLVNEKEETSQARDIYDNLRGSIVSFRTSTNLPYFSVQETVELVSSNPDDMIFYTLDGSYPSEKASLYKQPVVINESTTIRAIAINKNGDKSDVFSSTFTKISAIETEASAPGKTRKGVRYAYYEGQWQNLPVFAELKPVREGTLKTIEIPSCAREDYFGIVYTGYIKIPVAGLYTFSLRSDDGSRLVIDNIEVVINDGLHGVSEASGKIGLKAGLHPFKIEYFDGALSNVLQVFMEGPGMPRREMNAEDFVY